MPEETPKQDAGPPREPPPSSVKSIFGGLLFGIGLLAMGLSGLCSGIWIFTVLSELNSATWLNDALNLAGSILLFGGIPFAIGFVLFWIGRRMLRK